MTYDIRPVESEQELIEAFDVLGAQFPKPFTHEDRRFTDLARRFPQDRSLMLVVEDGGLLVGGALAFRGGEAGPGCDVTLRTIALVAEHRGSGLGRRLVECIEQEATRLGVRGIGLGADEAVGFYQHLGYRGKGGMYKALPLSSTHGDPDARHRALKELRERRAARRRSH
ncbi:Acetyltransferase (GNAT) family protein [Actinopolymorpha cephalotaxi]|uniref:Acetyltransferase (GNAT) family protein n=1 Tax=Actinopolymorpha cephalotaxi TaxID=504797 RepID=A0A1I2ZZ09_9ACTN|nr:GNAT family N-acetyltransferase [Actinopolymorpha cephalotaxi]NYH84245.1 GNAT superfamily N-acetyltransferase [Actinopolymorpha cephalotaxi]SFH42890.1 Acetyltransferase (GNAT) family protein [Actinopolymorpha cephalotaxi]